ncbi:MAG: single-stranded DNA-binding protein [Atopobiaceae bacterium]|nr:single-stranded DNA-binding protein [Atopobiaceae bacterium]
MSINKVCMSGNLTRDAELRQTQSGTAILRLGVAVNDRRKNQQTGEWEDVPNYIDCVLWGNRANALAQYLTKGTKVAIEGRLHWSSWEKDGAKRSKVEVYVDEVELMSRDQQQGQQQGQQPRQHATQYAPQAPAYVPQAPARQYAQQAPQAPAQVAYQPQSAPQQARQQVAVYDEDIPF